MSVPVLLALPWLVLPAVALWRLSRSTFLKDESAAPLSDTPFASVICPARNETRHVDGFVRAALASTYPRFELIVVDDHSTDDTATLARAAGAGDARLIVLDAPPLPAGWFGKQWACHVAAQRSRGDVMLFTDADTRHGPELLVRAVNAMQRRQSDLLSVAGRQELVSFWERVVQPTVFTVLFSAFGGTDAVSNTTHPKSKIANGQCLLVRHDTYRALGGHEAVRAYVAEDLMLAQRWCAAGKRVHLVGGLEFMSTRMYGSLGEIIEGWAKNVYAAGRYVVSDLPAVQVLMRVAMPLLPSPGWFPFVALVLGLTGVAPSSWAVFGAAAYGVSVCFAMIAARLIGIPLWYGFLHPLGACVASYIYAKAAWRGDQVTWKSRTYTAQ